MHWERSLKSYRLPTLTSTRRRSSARFSPWYSTGRSLDMGQGGWGQWDTFQSPLELMWTASSQFLHPTSHSLKPGRYFSRIRQIKTTPGSVTNSDLFCWHLQLKVSVKICFLQIPIQGLIQLFFYAGGGFVPNATPPGCVFVSLWFRKERTTQVWGPC